MRECKCLVLEEHDMPRHNPCPSQLPPRGSLNKITRADVVVDAYGNVIKNRHGPRTDIVSREDDPALYENLTTVDLRITMA